MNLYKSFALILCTIVIASCGGGGGGSSTPASSDATLSNLSVSAGAINPVFQAGITSYTLSVDNAVASSSVTPTISQSNATVTVNGAAVSSGSASSLIPLTVGKTVLTTVVTAEDGSTTETYTVIILRKAGVVSRELLDPTPGADNQFGSQVVVLGNGNIVVSDPFDSSRFATNGAVHLYSPLSSTPIASLFGDAGGDQLGNGQITALPNNNYVISSPNDNENGISNAGSVRLMNGNTGVQIGNTLAGDAALDLMGNGGITALENNNFVVLSSNDNENGISTAGSVRLINGDTGAQVGDPLVGDEASDAIGSGGITVLANSNYIVASPIDNENGLNNVGSVRQFNGSTGVQIGSTITGDVAEDALGFSSITVLANNNYVIASELDNENGIVGAGSVRLVNGSTGVQIGSTLSGNAANDRLGSSAIIALPNNNFVIASSIDDENGTSNAGSVRLVNGSTGVQVGATLVGDVIGDQLGGSSVTALANSNFIIASGFDDENGIVDVGSVRLVNGNTGLQIGSTLAGDVADDQMGRLLGGSGITALSNNNYVISSQFDDENGVVDAGSVRLVDGSTGLQIGSTLRGDVANDQLGSNGVTVLSNNNYVITSVNDNENGITNAGSVRLLDADTGVQIGSTLAGDMANDVLGNNSVTALSTDNYVIASASDDENGIVDAGSVRLINGSTGVQIGNIIAGEVTDDMTVIRVIKPVSGNYYILGLPFADNNALVNSGVVQIVAP